MTLNKKYEREKIMIITEGLVFTLLLVILVFRVKKSVEQEINFSRQQQNFILSITHELKSPLSSIKLMSETLKKHELKPEIKDKLITNSLYEVDRLQNLVENVLLAAKIDNDAYGFSKQKLNISDLSKQIVERCRTASTNKIIAEIDENIILEADKSGFTSIIINLLENAIKYSPENSPVYFSLTYFEENILMTVKDVGLGIAEEEKLKVFDKFYRVGNEEVRATKGTGLGLYIVNELVKFHKGNIEIYDNAPVGSIFSINFQV
ncbi:MAG: sensor histidine kinase [Chitinophagales bacterium]